MNLRPLTPKVVMLYPQNGDRIMAIDFVTSLHRMYRDLGPDLQNILLFIVRLS